MENLLETAQGIRHLSSTGGAGGVLDVFYSPFKLKVALNLHFAEAYADLLRWTYASYVGNDMDDDGIWSHPHGSLDSSSVPYVQINRIGCRLPDTINIQSGKSRRTRLHRCLSPHFDCCPTNLHGGGGKRWPRWRPIQCLLALTSTLEPNQGGFECTSNPSYSISSAYSNVTNPNPEENTGMQRFYVKMMVTSIIRLNTSPTVLTYYRCKRIPQGISRILCCQWLW